MYGGEWVIASITPTVYDILFENFNSKIDSRYIFTQSEFRFISWYQLQKCSDENLKNIMNLNWNFILKD